MNPPTTTDPSTTSNNPSSPTAREMALSITDRPYLSWSQVSSYQSCPRAYAFRYVDQAEPEFTPSSLCFGGAIHSAISLHHEARLEGADPPTHEQLMSLIRYDLEPVAAPIRFNKDEDRDSLLSLAERLIQAYLASDLANPEGEILCIEESVRASLDDDLPDLNGIVDLVTRVEQGLIVTDFKTTRSAWNDQKAEENAGQLRLYGELVRRQLEDAPVHALQFLTITKAKSPKVQLHVISASDEKLNATLDQVREVWRGIEAGVFPPRPGWTCRTCPFQSQCDSAAV